MMLIGRMKDYVAGTGTMAAGVARFHITPGQNDGGKGDLMNVTGQEFPGGMAHSTVG
jgi:hypothetical protein